MFACRENVKRNAITIHYCSLQSRWPRWVEWFIRSTFYQRSIRWKQINPYVIQNVCRFCLPSFAIMGMESILPLNCNTTLTGSCDPYLKTNRELPYLRYCNRREVKVGRLDGRLTVDDAQNVQQKRQRLALWFTHSAQVSAHPLPTQVSAHTLTWPTMHHNWQLSIPPDSCLV